MKTKILALAICLFLLTPFVFASADYNWSLGTSSDDLSVNVSGGSGSGVVSNLGKYGLPGGSIYNIIENILFWLLSILGVVAIIGFIISGIIYLTAAGDEDQAGRAKKAMMYSIVGVIIGLSGVVVIQAVNYMLRGYRNF